MAARRYEIFLGVLKNISRVSAAKFGLNGAVYYEAIAMVIFSHVKISSFRAKANLVFHWC